MASRSSPLFSVVIPTRNRARLLRYALQSALDQVFDDYEIVVSDNCSHDDTAQVVKELSTPRVRYVRVNRPLPMPEHWEFAITQAQGEYIAFLCDDDAWSPWLLQTVGAALGQHQSKLLAVTGFSYYGDDWFDHSRRNCVLLDSPHSQKTTMDCDSADTLRQVFAFRDLTRMPKMINSFCHRELLLKVREEYGGIFFLSPDYSFLALILTAIPSWTCLDNPYLRLGGVFPESIGASAAYNRGEATQEFFREFGAAIPLEHVPMKIVVVTNYIAETLLLVKERVGPPLASYDIDWEQYFINCWDNIFRYERVGVGVKRDVDEFLRVLDQQPPALRARVRTCMKRNPFRMALRRTISRFPFLMRVENLLRGLTPAGMIYGKKAGFRNILECARILHTLAPPSPTR